MIELDGITLGVTRHFMQPGPTIEPDPNWVGFDCVGHRHEYDEDFEIPTAEWVTTKEYFCDLCHDIHREGEYRCVTCGDVVKPGTRRARSRPVEVSQNVEGVIRPNSPHYEKILSTINLRPIDELRVGPYILYDVMATGMEESRFANKVMFEALRIERVDDGL